MIAAKYISTFNFCPKNVSNIESIAFPKNPETKTFKLKFPFKKAVIPPNTESIAAIIAIAKYFEYVYGIIGAKIPKSGP